MSGPASATSKQCAGPPPRPRLRRLATWSRPGWATWTLGTERGCCPHTTRRQCLINRRASSWPWAVSAALSRPPPDCDSGRSMTPQEGAVLQLRPLSFPLEEGKFEASRRVSRAQVWGSAGKAQRAGKQTLLQASALTHNCVWGRFRSLGSRRGGPPRPQRFGQVRG